MAWLALLRPLTTDTAAVGMPGTQLVARFR
jgi:hypothetical protein